MKTPIQIFVALLVCVAAFASIATQSVRTASGLAQGYVCPACNSPCDTLAFAAAGVCPVCGMALVEAGSAAAQPDPDQKKVAILVFDSCEILDFTGPYEMFGAAGCQVFTVAATRDPITTAMGLTVVPRYTFADAPRADVLVIPGGGIVKPLKDAATLDYIRKATEHTAHTMSVCNGAFILANTGLLDGLKATTTNGNLRRMAAQFPKVTVVHDQRYVDNGKLVTTGGLSAGMDGALHVIAKLFGTGYAQQVALNEEYDWQASSRYARGSLADQEIPSVPMDSLGTWTIERTEGDTHRWDMVANGKLKVSAGEFEQRVETALAAGRWTRVSTAGTAGASRTSTWRFTGRDGKPWKATLRLDAATAAAREVKASLSLARTS